MLESGQVQTAQRPAAPLFTFQRSHIQTFPLNARRLLGVEECQLRSRKGEVVGIMGPERRRQIDSVEDSPPSRVRTACKARRHTVREVKSSHHEPGGNKADDQRDERGGEIPRSSLSSNPRAGE